VPSETRANREQKLFFWLFALLVTACATVNLIHPKLADFRVYWFGIGTFLRHTKPLYGMTGGLGYPMLFRYPPAFVLFFSPLVHLSFRAAGAVWTILEWASLLAMTPWAFVRLQGRVTLGTGLGALVIAAPYLFLSFKDGNAQWLATALVLAALLTAADHPRFAGFALAAAVIVKVWPVLFVPLLLARERRKALVWVALCSAVLWAAPVFVFGSQEYAQLLHDWTAQELANHTGVTDIWYPSQSLRGVLLRFFSDPAVTQPYRADFPDVHVASLNPQLLVMFANGCGACALYYVLWGASRVRSELRFRWDALYFVAFSAFQPFCNRASLISITPAVLATAVSLPGRSWPDETLARVPWALAVALSGLEILSSFSRPAVHWFEALGLHFPLMLALGVSLWIQAGTYSEAGLFAGGERSQPVSQ
jgi:hypothetical protein